MIDQVTEPRQFAVEPARVKYRHLFPPGLRQPPLKLIIPRRHGTRYSSGFPQVQEIAPDPVGLFTALRRVQYDLSPLQGSGRWDWPRVPAEMRRSAQCLAVVNTRRDALALLEAVDDPSALHLSTLLCGAHRRQVVAEMRRRLAHREPCRVVSTQAIECGVDVDFPRVLRAVGPLDRIVQAAGRCNREGDLTEDGVVTVFEPADGHAPRGSYRVAMEVARWFLRDGCDLHQPLVFERCFRDIYQRDTLDARQIQRDREERDFPSVAEKGQLIDEDTVRVLVS